MLPSWPRRGPLRAYVDLSIAHWRVASYLRGATEEEPEPEPVDAPEPERPTAEPDRR